MMGGIWLVSCPGSELSWVRDEIFARDGEARLLRCSDAGALAGVAGALLEGEGPVSAALSAPGAGADRCEAAIAGLAGGGAVQDILVFMEQVEPGLIARCFLAGATEVITAGDADAFPEPTDTTCMGREAYDGFGGRAPADDEAPWWGERELQGTEKGGMGLHLPGARMEDSGGPLEEAGGEIDLDEPQGAAAWSGGTLREETCAAAGGTSAAADAGCAEGGCTGPDEPEAPPAEPAGTVFAEEPAPEDSAPGGSSRSASPDGDGVKPPAPAPQVADVAAAVGGEQASATEADERPSRAPLVAVISGRGGCGKTTLVASMAACAARSGLCAAVLDLDLMYGNLHSVLGVASFKGIEGLTVHADGGSIAEQDIEGTAMRIGPGLTLWGPCEQPERAELMTEPVGQLIESLRSLADVIFVDTSVSWGDTVAMAVGSCDRCLVVGGAGTSMVASTRRAVALAQRMGVPATRMTCVFNRLGAKGSGEDEALQFEIGVSLRSRTRIPDGGEEVEGMLSFGHVDSLVAGPSAFAKSIRSLTSEMLRELGCPVNEWLLEDGRRQGASGQRPRIRLPWRKEDDER